MAGQPKWITSLRTLLFSRRGIPILKGSIAYVLAFILIFSYDFDRLSKYPQTLVSMMIVVAAGGPGKAIGAVISAAILGVIGLLVGCLNFFILAKLSPWTVAQAVYFFFCVYVIAYVKTMGLRYFGATIFAILVSFNGIYTSLLLGKVFNQHYMIEYLKSYLWGFVINIAVALFIFPISSEKELRQTLLMSLQHIETFGMLISRSYLMVITPEERVIRDGLAQTIRADFGYLVQKLEETAVEINWSKWSLDDYRYFIAKTRALQLALISVHSSLASMEQTDDELYKRAFIPKTIGPFNRVRVDVRITIREIERAFGFEGMVLPRCDWDTYLDIERQVSENLAQSRPRGNSFMEMGEDARRDEELRAVADRLAAEFENGPHYDDESTTTAHSATVTPGPGSKPDSGETTPAPSPHVHIARELDEKETRKILKERGPQALAHDFAIFNDVQHELVTKTLTGGTLTDCSAPIKLKVASPQPSVLDAYGHDHVRGKDVATTTATPLQPSAIIRKRTVRHQSDESGDVTPDDESKMDPGEETPLPKGPPSCVVGLAGDHSLIRIYSMLFALSQYVSELEEFHARVMATDSKGRPRSKRLHFHFFERLRAPETPATKATTPAVKSDLSLSEALAILERREWKPKKVKFAQRVNRLKKWALGNDSIFALKTAGATSVFAVLIYADRTRAWFISYSLTGGLITVVVALAPTLGQSALTFLLQIAGSAIGYLVGLALLSIFHNVGGYVYNPYGIACFVFLYSIPLQYIIYEQPKYFALALLALNGTGVLIGTEWIYRDYYGRTFDTPAYRTGKALTALSVAIAIVAVFQLLVARNPARRSLRLALADIASSNLSYMVMLQAFVRAMIPVDLDQRVPDAAVARVHKECKRREIQIQGKIIAVMPLLMFAAVEPSLEEKFDPKPHLRVIKANQVILDRLREARGAVGTTHFNDRFLSEFVTPLSPYRRRSVRLNNSSLGISAASLSSRIPLPSEIPHGDMSHMLPDFLHDALVLSHRFAQTPEGREAVKSGEFTRYWFYVLCVTSIHQPLSEIRNVCIQLFGKLEDSLA